MYLHSLHLEALVKKAELAATPVLTCSHVFQHNLFDPHQVRSGDILHRIFLREFHEHRLGQCRRDYWARHSAFRPVSWHRLLESQKRGRRIWNPHVCIGRTYHHRAFYGFAAPDDPKCRPSAQPAQIKASGINAFADGQS